MTYLNTTRSINGGIADRIASVFRNLGLRYAQYRAYRLTVTELSGLDDRSLADLGINRSMISSIASEGAYGK